MKNRILYYFKMVKYLREFLKSSDIQLSKKVLVIILTLTGLIYLVTPIDLVPDLIPMFGFLEDGAVVLSMLTLIGKIIGKELNLKKEDPLQEETNKKVIDAEYEDVD
ncbi:MAG: YkvA family protein [Peptostreptococcaceae bacterium]|nr:YkvA family protein [Peptostreptococcaceae bacterium]